MFRLRNLALLTAPVTVAMVAWSCDRPTAPAGPQLDRPLFHVGQCVAQKFTGGGRIDPVDRIGVSGKMTFGFNIHVDAECNVIKGQFEVNHHPSFTAYHSVSFQSFDSFTETNSSGQTGECFDLNLTMRARHGTGPSDHTHTVFIQGCDYGEPGSSPGTGPDTWWFATTDGSSGDGHGDTGKTELTGGNIQAH